MHRVHNARSGDLFACRAVRTLSRIAILLSAISSGFAQPSICFVREHVTIDLDSTKGCVSGKYLFRNLKSVASQLPIFFPIPVTQECLAPEEVEVRFADEPLAFSLGPDGKSIRFRVPIEAVAEDTLEIRYCQPLGGHTFTYITTTIKGWGYPLDEAQFEISCPREWQLDISYPVERTEEKGDIKTYYFHQTSFYPEEDLKIQWSEIQAKEEP